MKTRLERLAEWGVTLVRDPQVEGEDNQHWYLKGASSDLEDEPIPDEKQAIRMIEAGCQVILLSDAIDDRLDWYSDRHDAGGWVCDVKLHDIWKWENCWRSITDQLPEPDDRLNDISWEYERSIIDSNYDFWLETLSKHLDPTLFKRLGRNGGHLVYCEDEMFLEEAEALVEAYESVPGILTGICQEIATMRTALRVADAWELDLALTEHDSFTLTDHKGVETTIGINYP